MKKKDSILSPQELSSVKGGNNANGRWEWDNNAQQWVWIERKSQH